MQKMLLQVRNKFQKQCFVPHGNVIEQYSMFVQLPHIAYMGHNWNSKFFASQTNSDKFTYTAHSYCICLDKAGAITL